MFEKIGEKPANSDNGAFSILEESRIIEAFADHNDKEHSQPSSLFKDLAKKIVLASKLHHIFSRVCHKTADGNDYELIFDNTNEQEILKSADSHFELGNLTRLLTKRFIKTVRGSSYEVDLRYHESVSMLHNIRNQLLRYIVKSVAAHYLTNTSTKWTGKDACILITQGLSLQNRGNYESLLQDHFFLQLYKAKYQAMEICQVAGSVVSLIKEKTQLKYVDQKILETQINKLEAGGQLRPNIDNNQGYTGVQLLSQMSYFKMYCLEDCCYKNSTYVSKDVEDWFEHYGLDLPWKESICEYFNAQTQLILKKTSKIEVHFCKTDNQPLKDRILVRYLSFQESYKKKSKAKFVRTLKIASKKAQSLALLHKITTTSLLRKFRGQSARLHTQTETAHAHEYMTSLQSRYTSHTAMAAIRHLISSAKAIRSMVRASHKFAYVARLTATAESFYTIRQASVRASKVATCVKIADSLVRVMIRAKQSRSIGEGFSLILRQSQIQKKMTALGETIDQAYIRSFKHSFLTIQDYAEAKMKKHDMEKQSLTHLRRSYLLNNVSFILKYHFSMQHQKQERAAFNAIKRASDSKKLFYHKVKKLCEKVDSAIRRKFIRLTLGSFSEYRSQETTHDYKIGFHFLELYINRRLMKASLDSIADSCRPPDAWIYAFDRIESFLDKSIKSRVLAQLRSIGRMRRGLDKLRSLLELKKSSVKLQYGKKLIYGLEAIRKLRKQRVQQRVIMAAAVLNGLFKKNAFRDLQLAKKPILSRLKIAVIKLELILLRGQKQAYKAGIFSLHKKWVKKVHLDTQKKLQIRHQAASRIQAFLKMTLFRRYYNYIIASIKLIQRTYRKYYKRKQAKRSKIVSQIAFQRKRMTEIRETAVQRFKENLSSQKEAFNKRHNFSKKTECVSLQEQDLSVLEEKLRINSQIAYTCVKPSRVDNKRYAPGKENDIMAGIGRQPASMMKLNMDSNQLENIKRYKNKVLTNHIKQREIETTIHEPSFTPHPRQTEKDGHKPKASKNIDPDPTTENLKDLISGVKSKIHHIRQTQRSKYN